MQLGQIKLIKLKKIYHNVKNSTFTKVGTTYRIH